MAGLLAVRRTRLALQNRIALTFVQSIRKCQDVTQSRCRSKKPRRSTMMKARMFVLLSLALGTASAAFAQAPVQLKFSRVVDLTLPIETNMAGIPGFKIYADNPSQVAIIAA